MMNFPGVLHGDPEVLKKIASAKKYEQADRRSCTRFARGRCKKLYNAGITTDHECVTADEALDKFKWGMKILIREGSAAEILKPWRGCFMDHWENIMFCSDDKHPDSLVSGHINQLCARAAQKI